MKEPGVSSSDVGNIATQIVRDGDEYVITGRKWWSTGVLSPDCRLLAVLGVSDPDADGRTRYSIALVPRDAPGTDLLQRGDHRSVQALEPDIRAWITKWNEDPKPFV